MKIDFDGSYKEVSRLLRNTQAPAERSSGFSETLASISPDRQRAVAQAPRKTDLSSTPPALSEEAAHGMGSLRLAGPEQKIADFRPLSTQFQTEDLAPKQEQGVNTPTLLEVKRIEIPLTPQPRPELSAKEKQLELVRGLIDAAGDKHGIDPALGMAVVKNESNFNEKAVSQDGHSSKGLFQLLDSTGKDLMGRLGVKGSYDPFDPSTNVELGVSYLRYLHDIFSSPTTLSADRTTQPAANSASLEKLAVAAFNAGEGRVASAQARAERAGKDATTYEHVSPYLPQSTQQYVDRVMSSKKLF